VMGAEAALVRSQFFSGTHGELMTTR
jgi:cystathionine beta-lyase family protein involved in aluminum resistance